MKNIHLAKYAALLLVMVSLVLMAGCISPRSTIATRKQERPAVYAALSPEFKTAVDQGQVQSGMNMDTVYLAWGNPSETTTGGNQTGQTTTWIYRGGYTEESRVWGGYRMFYTYTPVTYTRAQVIFANGAVIQWQTYPHP